MQIRISTGLLRLWLVATVIWVAYFALSFGSEYVALASKVKTNAVSFDDLIPVYKPCWDYRTEDGKNIDVTKLSDSALIRIYECEHRIDRFDLVKRALTTMAGVPLLLFVFGWSLLWIGRGFRPQN
jgi:hypothetical protein